MLVAAVASYVVVESYPDDKYLPSFLIRGEAEHIVFHAQIVTDVQGSKVRIVPMYAPEPDEWDEGFRVEEKKTMKCRICGGSLGARITDLPFKIADFSIVILKFLPVLQCRQCAETELEHQTMLRVDQLLSAADKSAELEVIQFAA